MHDNRESIVITGIGVVSPLGMDADSLWSSLEEGFSNRTISNAEDQFGNEYSYWTKSISDWNPQDLLGTRGLKFLQPGTQYLIGASIKALQDAGLSPEELEPEDLGVVVGSNFAGMKMSWEYDYTARTEGPKYVSPMQAPNTLVNSPASHLALKIKSRACNTTISSGQCAGLDAIGYAKRILQRNQAKYVLVGGTEEINPSLYWYYRNSKLLVDHLEKPIGYPYNEKSEGIVPGEGASVLIMERLSDAKKRNASILAEVGSWASAFSNRNDKEQGRGLEKSIRKALAKSGHSIEDVKLILSGANGLPWLDSSEVFAINNVFSKNVPVRSIKSMIGELSGANGIFQMAAAIGVLCRNNLPHTELVLSHGSNGLDSSDWKVSGSDCILLIDQDLFGSSSAVVVKGV